MKILLFGGTGRVGISIISKALEKGHQIVAFIRNKNKLAITDPNLSVLEGDIYDTDAFERLGQVDFDLVVNVIGADPLKPSTIFCDATRLIKKLLSGKQGKRYLAITGVAQMKKTLFGKISISLLKLTPVRHGIRDHQNAFNEIVDSDINWTLVGCPYIKDGVEKREFEKNAIFSGGFKTIHPGDVAKAIVEEIEKPNHKEIIGIWY